MQYELTKEEVQLIEKYRDLLPEFRNIADKMLDEVANFQEAFINLSRRDK